MIWFYLVDMSARSIAGAFKSGLNTVQIQHRLKRPHWQDHLHDTDIALLWYRVGRRCIVRGGGRVLVLRHERYTMSDIDNHIFHITDFLKTTLATYQTTEIPFLTRERQYQMTGRCLSDKIVNNGRNVNWKDTKYIVRLSFSVILRRKLVCIVSFHHF